LQQVIYQVIVRLKNGRKSSRGRPNPKKSISFAKNRDQSAYQKSQKKEERKKESVNYSTSD
jgi:hypothetical protein